MSLESARLGKCRVMANKNQNYRVNCKKTFFQLLKKMVNEETVVCSLQQQNNSLWVPNCQLRFRRSLFRFTITGWASFILLLKCDYIYRNNNISVTALSLCVRDLKDDVSLTWNAFNLNKKGKIITFDWAHYCILQQHNLNSSSSSRNRKFLQKLPL